MQHIVLSIVFSLISYSLFKYLNLNESFIIFQSIAVFLCTLFLPIFIYYEKSEDELKELLNILGMILVKPITKFDLIKMFKYPIANIDALKKKVEECRLHVSKVLYQFIFILLDLKQISKKSVQNLIEFLINYIELKRELKVEVTLQIITLYSTSIILPFILANLKDFGNIDITYMFVLNFIISLISILFDGKWWRFPYIFLILNFVSYFVFIITPYIF